LPPPLLDFSLSCALTSLSLWFVTAAGWLCYQYIIGGWELEWGCRDSFSVGLRFYIRTGSNLKIVEHISPLFSFFFLNFYVFISSRNHRIINLLRAETSLTVYNFLL
jgi:hypothetical protein